MQIISAIAATAPAVASAQSLFDVSISSGTLREALLDFADQNGLQLVFETDIANGVKINPVQGQYTLVQVLQKLLSGTQISYRIEANKTIVLSRKHASGLTTENLLAGAGDFVLAQAEPEEKPDTNPVEQEDMTVTGGETGGYSVLDANTATKTDTPIMETPASISVIPRKLLEDQQAVSIDTALRNVAGATSGFSFEGLTNQAFLLRGFSTEVGTVGGVYYREGVRLQRIPVSMATLEQIELFKGPGTILYGRAQPGGLINLVPKNPSPTPYYSLQQQFGSFNLYRTTADATGPIFDFDNLRYRGVLENLTTNSFRDQIFEDVLAVAPTLSWDVTNDTQVELEFQYIDKKLRTDQGIPALGMRPADIPIGRYLMDTISRRENDSFLVDIDVSHRLNPDWKITWKGVFATEMDRGLDVFPTFLDESTGALSRGIFGQDINRSTGYTSINLFGNFDTIGIQHRFLIGGDYYNQDSEATIGFFAAPDINIFNPIDGIVPVPNFPADGFEFESLNEWFGFYLQDQITLFRQLHLLLGGRFDHAVSANGTPPATRAKNNELSPRFGILYSPLTELSLWGSYTESFGTNNGISPDNSPFEPEKAKQFEFGLKTELFDGRMLNTLTFYNLTKTNVLAPDPNNPIFSIPVGEARSRGIELEIAGNLSDRLDLIGSYAYTDTKITKDTAGNEGNRLNNVPLHSGSLWVNYSIWPKFTVGSGIFAASSRQVDNENSALMPGYLLLNAKAAYSWNFGRSLLTAQVNVNNILDKTYYKASSGNRLQIIPGAPINVIGSIRLEY